MIKFSATFPEYTVWVYVALFFIYYLMHRSLSSLSAVKRAKRQSKRFQFAYKLLNVSVTIGIILVILSSAYSSYLALTAQSRTLPSVLGAVSGVLFLFLVAFHIGAFLFGPSISEGALGDFLAKSWVRMIDYFYLTGSTFGILRIAISGVGSSGDLTSVNAFGIIMLGAALALRLTKTSIEIFGWDKPRR